MLLFFLLLLSENKVNGNIFALLTEHRHMAAYVFYVVPWINYEGTCSWEGDTPPPVERQAGKPRWTHTNATDVQLGSPKSHCARNWANALSEPNCTDFSAGWLCTAAHGNLPQGTVRASVSKTNTDTHKWQKSLIWWHKFLQKNLEMQLVWSSKIIISKQLKKFQHLFSCFPWKLPHRHLLTLKTLGNSG